MAKLTPVPSLVALMGRIAKPVLPASLYRSIGDAVRGNKAPSLGQVDMGDLARARPIGDHFGYDRGTPVDRWYIERFLASHADDISGRVLEIGDAGYSRRFGRGITRQDVLHLNEGNAEATIIGDLTQDGLLPGAAFDCLVITQTLQFIYDTRQAVAELKRSLAPNGVLLLTVPGVSSVDRGEWKDCWFWSLTEQSARRMFEEEFGAGNVEITAHGNVYSAICFLHGLAFEEIDSDLLRNDDPAYPMVICVRALRGG
jgi:SAM-dependent methyltransferase